MITVVGGTYHERCLEPFWEEAYGSGLRACRTFMAIDRECEVELHTFLEKELVSYLDSYSLEFQKFEFKHQLIQNSLTFYYDYPLGQPRIFPRLDLVKRGDNHLNVYGDTILLYGFLEGTASVHGRKVVYDPQSPVSPTPFHKTESTANELAIVANLGEARALAGSNDLVTIKKYFFEQEKASVAVIKMGAQGALVTTSDGSEALVPVYKTDRVWSIGSGDVYTALFSYFWFKTNDPIAAARRASYGTAEFCTYRDFQFTTFESNVEIKQLTIKANPKGKVYLAGPFFTFAHRWLIDQVKRAFEDMGVQVFSPFHDVGFGLATEVASRDLKALEECSAVIALLDGLDPGTLFEVGYAVAREIPVIGVVQNEPKDSLTMIEGTGCQIEEDLTTAIYKTYWQLAENE